ncbi:AP-2 complex subunit sigma [Cryptococcus gattii EJB2]|uniref:AP-2 complex subunit sigma n=1 Tax=Cryptococcus gattii EJB2 TaxID=1296103 RepID=A0ABR5BQY0_9TREE|nr:AP-2 complex subunit sigma [Cryptococcus gattii EJB2]KJE01514.1 AP-2 complex subunit sigma [Cryptococcus gattii NT-10]
MRPTTTTKRQQSSVSRLIDPLLPSALDSLPTLPTCHMYSSGTTRSSTDDTPVSSSASASIPTTMSSRTSRPSISL